MNFLPATVEGTSVKLPFGTVSIPEAKAKKAQGKGLLIAGIRPEHFEDAAVMDSAKHEGSTFKTTVDVVEWLGNQAYAYSPFEAPPEKGMVWVNLDSKRYHKETSAWYGRTKNGKYMSEAEAVKAGYTAANMRVKNCTQILPTGTLPLS